MGQQRRERSYYRIVCGAGIALLLTGFVFFARPEPSRAATTVSMQNVAFVPATITITVGTTVTWTNNDTVVHTTTSNAGGTWDSSILDKGKSFSFTFSKAGTFAYHCDVHPNMHGTITVNPAAPATATATLQPTNTPPPPTPTTPNTATPTTVISNPTTVVSNPTATLTTVPNPASPFTPTSVRPTPTSVRTATPTTIAAGTATVMATSAVATTATTTATAASDTPAPVSAAPSANAAPGGPRPEPVSALAFANFLEPIPSFPETPDHRYFTATGHSLNFGFKAYWEQNGGVAQFGYPISEEFIERGGDSIVRTVQYFERARFEYHLDLTTIPFQVELGMLGREMAAGRGNQAAFVPVSADAASAGRQFFAATGHTLGGQFAAYWQANGGMAHFGLPISEEFQETGADGVSYTVQYFERYRLEYHPGTSSVELGRLGVQDAQSRGYLPAS